MLKSDFLHSISPSSTVQSILRNLQDVKNTIESADVDPKSPDKSTTSDAVAKVDESIKAVTILSDEISKLNKLVASYQAQADANLVSVYLVAGTAINDYKSAYDATIYYDKIWFSKTMFSHDGKINLAFHLLKAIQEYCQDNTETLQMIVNGDSDILRFIKYPRKDS